MKPAIKIGMQDRVDRKGEGGTEKQLFSRTCLACSQAISVRAAYSLLQHRRCRLHHRTAFDQERTA